MFFIQIIWLYLPAGISNSCATIFRKLNFLNIPIDLNKKINEKPIFGKNKTYRGFFFGTIFSIIIVFIQKRVYLLFPKLYLFNYTKINPFIMGFLLGFGALAGDLIESFIKRRFNKNPGQPFIPFDQIDWIIGANIFLLLYIEINLKIFITSIIALGIIHPITNIIAYNLKIKNTKY